MKTKTLKLVFVNTKWGKLLVSEKDLHDGRKSAINIYCQETRKKLPTSNYHEKCTNMLLKDNIFKD